MCEKLEEIQKRVKAAALKVGRDPSSIKIVAVSKKKPASQIEQLYRCGQKIFGENYVQEAVRKIDALSSFGDISWHFIGHLQKNKAKLAVKYFNWIEGVDSFSLAKLLNKYALKAQKKINCLIQVNIGREKTKSGILEEEIVDLIESIIELEALSLKGFMTIHPRSEHVEDSRHWFKKMKVLLEKYQARYPFLKELSMGMSKDFEIAIEEGATIVRIGTALFGPRD